MAILNRDQLDARAAAFEEAANSAFARPNPLADMFMMDLGVGDAETVDVGYVEDTAQTRILAKGETRTYDSLGRAYFVEYVQKYLSRNVEVPVDDIAFDRTGRIRAAQDSLLDSGRHMVERYIWDLLTANPVGMDQVSLLSDSHPNGPNGTNQSNILTADLGFPAYDAAQDLMRSLGRENGDPLDIAPTHLFVPPQLRRVALEIAGETRPIFVDDTGSEATTGVVAATNIPNVFQGEITVVISKYFPNPTDYLFMDLSRDSYRPWGAAFAIRPRGEVTTNMDSDAVRDRRVVPHIVEAQLATGPAHWFTVCGRLG